MRMQDFQTQQKPDVTEARHNADEAFACYIFVSPKCFYKVLLVNIKKYYFTFQGLH